ncbi:ArsR/SmtB family transcription factor [Clostridium kluyveri]|uniref:Transcriptional regulator n=1 Tax=Clostridium kluyveri TaxID=1534 RepID=A0A1L5FDG9_CLOKL|nr:metalloregulator ArsR/SmtB family transcription factor [Clostridium kluyveri]APM41055.1 transcriptional regulator [Clostridium kluyveri]
MKDDSKIEVCSCTKINKQNIEYVKENMLSEKTFMKLSELFKILGDYTRIKIIYSLSKKELCVCDIAEVVQMSQSAISHQLRILKAARLVKFRREGKSVYYSLDDEHIDRLFNAGLEHVEHN